MSQWGSCLARLRECVRRLILDEVDEESVGLFENEDKVCGCLGGERGAGMFVGPARQMNKRAVFLPLCGAFGAPNPLSVCLSCDLPPSCPSLCSPRLGRIRDSSSLTLSIFKKAHGRLSHTTALTKLYSIQSSKA